MLFSIWGKPQFFQSCIYQRLVWISDAKGTFCFYAVSEKLIVHILHDHIRALQPFLTLNRLAFPQKLSIAVFVKPTESARKCSLSGSIDGITGTFTFDEHHNPVKQTAILCFDGATPVLKEMF